jgi:hypothetical protein
MALGTITFRCGSKLLAEIWESVKRKTATHRATPAYSVSDFIRDAIVEKIRHGERSRKSSAKKRGQGTYEKKPTVPASDAANVLDDSSDFPRHLEG